MSSTCRFEPTSETSMQFGRDKAHSTPWHERHYFNKYYPPCSSISERRDKPYADLAFTAFVNALRRIRKTGGIRHDSQKAGCRYRTKLGTLCPLAQAALDRRIIGTGKYKAYEVCSGNPCTEQSEIHAVVTLLETICDKSALDILEPVIRKGRSSGLSERYPDYETLRDAIHKAKRRSQLPKMLAVTAGVVAVFGILIAAMLKVFNADRQAERQSTFERIGLRAYAATNYVKAAHFLQRAADTGSANGLVYYELAEIHARGRGIRQDRIQAISYAQRAFDLGFTNALPMLRRLKKLQGATTR